MFFYKSRIGILLWVLLLYVRWKPFDSWSSNDIRVIVVRNICLFTNSHVTRALGLRSSSTSCNDAPIAPISKGILRFSFNCFCCLDPCRSSEIALIYSLFLLLKIFSLLTQYVNRFRVFWVVILNWIDIWFLC